VVWVVVGYGEGEEHVVVRDTVEQMVSRGNVVWSGWCIVSEGEGACCREGHG
jgi:hypothetical protein